MENHKKSTLRLRLRVTARKKGRELIPGECSDRKRRERECPNSVRKLQRREIGGVPPVARGPQEAPAPRDRRVPPVGPRHCDWRAREVSEYPAPGCLHAKPLMDPIIQVRNSNLIEVSRTEFMTPSAFIFLYENHLFLTFRNRTVAVWNFRGELVTSFEDHLLWHPDCNTNNIYITSDQDLIISYCKAEDGCDEEGEVPTVGSINMSNILTGKCIAKICPLDPALQITPRKQGDNSRSTIRSTIREALEDVTALFYDEDRNEIYTGNKQGLIHVWSN
ncbi:hypothetical protein B296_00037017 [Ensete ventricosum]|uniref:Transducin/WD40 repeat-like superfamily protein n=1 Tax=Ensete ventricosum TaxID=4639 RepID=A0A426Y9X3_ENSVE|nr:hypothetical protein B296_00037017 [Ensete ventricosum]